MTRNDLFRKCLATFVGALLATGAAKAQSTTQGAIAGTVEDVTGAVIPGATATVVNVGTRASQTVTTDSSGYFKIPLIEPGTYKVTITATGFGTYVGDNVVVNVSQLTTLLPKLTTGTAETTVSVTADANILNFESPDLSYVLDQSTIANLPTNNRRWSSLALTTPGVVDNGSGYGVVSVRGISNTMNNVEIDGADDNNAYYAEERGRTREAYSTSEAAVREFAVNTGVYSAEYGRAAGGVINSVTKSGTNAIHGEAYFYDRESNWNAYQVHTLETVPGYTPGNPIPTSFNTIHLKPKDLRKIFGFTAGGALLKDKLFWSYTFDKHARIFPAVGSPGNPQTFFATPDASLTGINGTPTCNTSTGYLTGSATSTSPIYNPNYTLDAQACTLAAREGLTSYAAGAAAYNAGLASFLPDLGFTPRTGYQGINTPKLDWQINPKEHLSLLYHRLRWDSPGGVQTSGVVPYAIDTQGTDFVKLDYGVAKLTSLISSRLSNEVLYQYSRELENEGQQPFSAYTLANLVAGNGNIPQIGLDSSTGFTLGSPYYSYRTAQPSERKWQVEDVAYLSKGNHSLKFGVDLLHNDDFLNVLNGAFSGTSSAQNGTYTYTYIGNYLADLHSKGGPGTCNATGSSAATGNTPSTTAVGNYQCYAANGFSQTFGNPIFELATLDYGFFVQDNWKVLPRLTLELGMRYDYQHLPQQPANLVNAAIPQSVPSDKNNFGPRVGFSWDVYGGGRTVLRAGYGMYYGRINNGTIVNTYLNAGLAAGQYTTAYSPAAGSVGPSPVFPFNATTGTVTTPGVFYFASNFQNPMVHEFDAIVQQELGRGTVFAVSYIGALGRELPNFLNFNLDPTTVQTSSITFVDTTGLSPIPNNTVVPVKTYTHYANPTYQGITEVVSNINSSYNGLVAEIQNRSLKRVEFDANYTWSHALDFAQNAQTSTTTENWLDPYASARSNYGNSIYNTPNNLSAYVVYRLPNFVSDKNLFRYLANGWNIDDSFSAGSGLPYSATVTGSTTKNSISTGWEGTGYTTYIPQVGRNTYKYPRHFVDNTRVEKAFDITERYHLNIFLNVFNVANHQNVDGINNTMYTLAATSATTGTATYRSTFGAITTSNASNFLFTPRNLEIGAKFRF